MVSAILCWKSNFKTIYNEFYSNNNFHNNSCNHTEQISHDINMIQQYRKYILQTYLKFQWAYDVNLKYTHTTLYHVTAACHHIGVSILWRLHISCLSLSDWMLQVSFFYTSLPSILCYSRFIYESNCHMHSYAYSLHT